jgi:hypothetical protein
MEAELWSTAVAVMIASDGPAMRPLPVERIDLLAFGSIAGWQALSPTSDLLAPYRLRLMAGQEGGSISAGPLRCRRGSAVALRVVSRTRALEVTVSGDHPTLALSLAGKIRGLSHGAEIHMPRSDEDAVLQVAGEPLGAGILQYQLPLGEECAELLQPGLVLVGVDVHREALSDAPGAGVRARTSTLVEGSIHNASMGGQPIRLREHEQVVWTGLRGTLRSAELKRGLLHLNISGHVSDVTVTTGGVRRSLLPSWLEYLASQHGVKLFWAGLVWIGGLVIGGARLWSKPFGD